MMNRISTLMMATMIGLMATACSGSGDQPSPSPSVPVVTSSAAAKSACRDSIVTSRAEKLTTKNVDELKGRKVWACQVGGDGDGDVMPQGPITQADVDTMRKDPILADVPLPSSPSCEVEDGAVYIFLDDGRVFRHRLVGCSEEAGS